jgi:hypothetical protein
LGGVGRKILFSRLHRCTLFQKTKTKTKQANVKYEHGMIAVTALRRLRQEDQEFEANIGYRKFQS